MAAFFIWNAERDVNIVPTNLAAPPARQRLGVGQSSAAFPSPAKDLGHVERRSLNIALLQKRQRTAALQNLTGIGCPRGRCLLPGTQSIRA